MNKRLALVEDDDVLRANYTDLLSQAGFRVEAYRDKSTALSAFRRSLPDIALIDIALGDERDAGFELCGELRRASSRLPIVFLTSHDDDIDRISGLRLGADDYLTKDVSVDYLVVRVETLIRRLNAVAGPDSGVASAVVVVDSDLVLDDAVSRARWKGQDLELTLTQYWILREICRHLGQAASHADLMRAARIVVEPNTITAHVKSIRDAFRRLDPQFDRLRAERGRGYRWVATISGPPGG